MSTNRFLIFLKSVTFTDGVHSKKFTGKSLYNTQMCYVSSMPVFKTVTYVGKMNQEEFLLMLSC